MQLEQERTDPFTNQHPQSQADTRLHGGWLLIARVGWLALTLLVLTLSAIALPRYYALAQSVCQPGAQCLLIQLRPVDLRLLHQLGLSPGFLAAYQVGWAVGTVLIYSALATLIFWRRSSDRMALFCAYMLVLPGIATYTQLFDYGLRPLSPAWYWLVGGLELLGLVGFMVFFLLFPSGRFVPRWTRWGVLVIVLLETQYVFFSDLLHRQTDASTGLTFVVLILGLVGLQIYRYRRVSTFRERQQTRWVIYGFSVAIVGIALFISIGDILLSPEARAENQVGNVLVMGTYDNVLLLLIPISIAIAILRTHLWDIDIIINRTLVYGALTVCVVSIYILVVGYLGSLFRTGGNLPISLVATGLVAVLFQPLRGLLQRWVNRLLYGQRDEPYAVIRGLSQRLEATLAPDAILPTIVETIAQALKLPYAAITLQQGGDFVTAASYGSPQENLTRLPLIYQTGQIGELLLAPRGPGETFTSADRALLNDLARQAGVAAHAVRLTTDLQRLTGELQQSRTQLVTTQEEERRRLRRDLHDGLGSALTSVTFQLDAACNLLDHDPQAVRTLLMELKGQMQTSIADIRRLVYNLRPPILDEWGLVAALREQVAQYQLHNVQVTVDAPESLPALPAAVEVAAYRIALEALANVVLHAHASTCSMRLSISDNALIVELEDDGSGLPRSFHAGVGINAMRERAAELGGSCTVESLATGGTRVSASLPLMKE
jgi:signal transduction histidine kinase